MSTLPDLLYLGHRHNVILLERINYVCILIVLESGMKRNSWPCTALSVSPLVVVCLDI